MSKCRRCGKLLPPGHGYCDPCACYADGYDSGAHYSDDFGGVNEEEVTDFFEAVEEEYNLCAIEHCGIFRAHLYLEGVRDGLRQRARYLAERLLERAQEEHDDVINRVNGF